MKAQLQFNERYFVWAMEHWTSEIHLGFPFLRTVGQQLVIEIMESLGPQERESFGKALAKRGYRADSLSDWGYALSAKDKEFQDLYLSMVEGVVSGQVTFRRPEDHMFKEAFSPEQRRRFKTCIIQSLIPALGEEYEDWGDWKEWRYCTSIGPWQVITRVDVGGRTHQLCYDHSIIASEHVYLAENINLLRWLGISSQTQWHGLSDQDIEPTAASLVGIVAHFMDAAAELLEGLTPD